MTPCSSSSSSSSSNSTYLTAYVIHSVYQQNNVGARPFTVVSVRIAIARANHAYGGGRLIRTVRPLLFFSFFSLRRQYLLPREPVRPQRPRATAEPRPRHFPSYLSFPSEMFASNRPPPPSPLFIFLHTFLVVSRARVPIRTYHVTYK